MNMEDTIRRLNLLIVDDDEMITRALAREMAKHWHSVKAVNRVEQAFAEIASGQYHVVLSDWDMPGGGGRAILDRSHIPVVIHTGGWLETLRRNMNGTIIVQKPASTKDLLIALHQAAKKSCL